MEDILVNPNPEGRLHIFDRSSTKLLHSVEQQGAEYLSFSEDSARLIAHGLMRLGVWELATGKNVLKRRYQSLDLYVSPDGKLAASSYRGQFGTVDLSTGKLTTVTQLPGFTRGLDFFGPFAFIGLSQVRESATFSGIPLVDRLEDRICGVWVVHIQTAETVAFLRFEEAVQEIFAVQALPGIRFPEILEPDDPLIGTSYVLPDEMLADVPGAAR